MDKTGPKVVHHVPPGVLSSRVSPDRLWSIQLRHVAVHQHHIEVGKALHRLIYKQWSVDLRLSFCINHDVRSKKNI